MTLRFPPSLPISERVEEICQALDDHQVIIVAGETGSGKSTQLPKICLAAGLGQHGRIGHTQPRRLAARSVAERIAEETGTKVGDLVGYKVRFTDEVGKNTRIKLMTDGVLLAEIQRDRTLSRYEVIIIDEAHERSLNIDFLLGYLCQLLPRRPDLKLIVTSATIDTDRFSRHFSNAPIIEVSGRNYPVEIRYRPVEPDELGNPIDQPRAIVKAVHELWRSQPGDILVFCSGERAIRDAHVALEDANLVNTEIFPLYARLSAAEQHRVFASHSRRRIVLATNVAETSLTVPGIRSVIDPGFARISRYSNRTKVQRLPIEPISQASANQRSGRCGRLGPGVCIRLYPEEDFEGRPEYTEPEIQRTNLASVILQMASLGLGDISAFPFVEPPETRSIRDGIALLEELDAVDPDRFGTNKWLTPMGRKLARLPVDPRLGRMIVEASRNQCLHQVMVIVAAMSVQDPRERPQENRQAAAEMHRRFAHPTSDFLSYLELWDYVKTERRARSQNQFRKLCRREFLNFNRIREWQDIYRQLRRVSEELNLSRSSGVAQPEDIHYSLLSGLLSHVGLRDDKTAKRPNMKGQSSKRDRGRRRIEFLGARGSRFTLTSGSTLAKKPPRWIVAGELVETNQLWATTVAQIDPAWAERLGEHLLKRTYTEPWWNAERGAAQTIERASLYGLPILAGRTRNLDQFDSKTAREMFIHHALVEGDWQAEHQFITDNENLKAEIQTLEAKVRQNDLMADQTTLVDFYDRRLPASITSAAHFEAWWRKKRRSDPQLLTLTRQVLLAKDDTAALPNSALPNSALPNSALVESFPDHITIGENSYQLDYVFDPTSPLDGITISLPLVALNEVEAEDFSWLVPGFLSDLAEFLIRSLPKPTRKAFVPIPDTVARILPTLSTELAFPTALRRGLERDVGLSVPVDEVDHASIPPHLRPVFRVVGHNNKTIGAGRDLEALRDRMQESIQLSLKAARHPVEAEGLSSWNFGELPKVVKTMSDGHPVRAYPSLIDAGDHVDIRLLVSVEAQSEAMWAGTRKLLRLQVPSPLRTLNRALDPSAQLALAANETQTKAQWFTDALDCALDHMISDFGGPVFDQDSFFELVAVTQKQLPSLMERMAAVLSSILLEIQATDLLLDPDRNPPLPGPQREWLDEAHKDARQHRDRLVYPTMLRGVGYARLEDMIRYLGGIRLRLEALPDSVRRDREAMMACRKLETRYARSCANVAPSPVCEAIGWQLEELRVAKFAPSLVSRLQKVTERRVKTALGQLDDS